MALVHVDSGAAVQEVQARSAHEEIVPFFAVEKIVFRAAEQVVIPSAAGQPWFF